MTCDNDTLTKAIQTAVTVESAIGMTLEITILAILVWSKVYKTFLQRLFVWAVLILIVYELTRVTSFAHQYIPDQVCKILDSGLGGQSTCS